MSTMARYLTPSVMAPRVSIALLALRIIAGIAFMYHGWGKIQNPFSWMGPDATVPAFLQFLAALSEFGGGLAWVVGLLTPLASFGLLSTMVVAASTHMLRGDPFVGKGGSYELAAIYGVISLLLLLAGPGRMSLDAMIWNKRTH